MSVLADCHKELEYLLATSSTLLESLQAAQCVERHRMIWRPEVVHTLLLAESHVFTSDSELQPMNGPHDLSGRELHRTFARFVYCLGYGESEFAGLNLPSNAGTPQFWKLFASCVHVPSPKAFAPLLKGTNPSLLARLKAKLALLETLHAMGVWLVDASAIALYCPGGARLHQSDYEHVLRSSWRIHTGKMVREAAPHSVVVIGKGVAAALGQELRSLTKSEIHCVSQPQGCRAPGAIELVYETLHRVCRHAAISRGI